MFSFYEKVGRPLLFRRDSEEVHNLVLNGLGMLAQSQSGLNFLRSFHETDPLPTEAFGLKFPNPVGLAAGMDKRAHALPAWAAIGFGFCELGGVTALEQPGNPPPRMFRVVAEDALINRMGFNNPGAEKMAASLARWKASHLWPNHPVGMNLGKSKNTPMEDAPSDYSRSVELLKDYVDFFVINVSSPNTPNLRQLQDKDALSAVLSAVQNINSKYSRPKPVLVKIAPDLSLEAIDEILSLTEPHRLSGIVATNTTISRPVSYDESAKMVLHETGGLSGRPLGQRSTEIIRHIYRQSSGRIKVIGVGGIFNADDAWEKFTNGASLVQIYTGLVYRGPGIVSEILGGLARRLKDHGFRNIQEAVGTAA